MFRHGFAARSCCDRDLQGSQQNFVRNTSSQYGDHFCEIVFKSYFYLRSYGPNTILLQCHAVTLTFDFAAMSCRDLDLQSSGLNSARETSF